MKRIDAISGGNARQTSVVSLATAISAIRSSVQTASGQVAQSLLNTGVDVRIQLRRDTVANWIAANSIIGDGEIAIATDLRRRFKIGDGVSRWSDLEFSDQSTIDSLLESLDQTKGLIEEELIPPHSLPDGKTFHIPTDKQVVVGDSRLVLGRGSRLIVDGKLLWSGGGGIRWENIDGKPNEFRPSTHTQEIRTVIGLESELNNKAPMDLFKPWFQSVPSALSLTGNVISGTIHPGYPHPVLNPGYRWDVKLPSVSTDWLPLATTQSFTFDVSGFIGQAILDMDFRMVHTNSLGEVVSDPIKVDYWGVVERYVDGSKLLNTTITINGAEYHNNSLSNLYTGTKEFIVTKPGFFDLLMVGAGGGGGYRGGGGAGGVAVHRMIYLVAGKYSPTFGPGGVGGTVAGADGTAGGDTYLTPVDGEIKVLDSSGSLVVVSELRVGGGAPGAAQGKTTGIDGPNGGGAPSATANAAIYPGGAATATGGFAGGAKPLNRLNSGGGGGGAGGAGGSSSTNNVGGIGGAPMVYGSIRLGAGGGGYGSTIGGNGGDPTIPASGRGMTNTSVASGISIDSGMGGGAGGNGADGRIVLLSRRYV